MENRGIEDLGQEEPEGIHKEAVDLAFEVGNRREPRGLALLLSLAAFVPTRDGNAHEPDIQKKNEAQGLYVTGETSEWRVEELVSSQRVELVLQRLIAEQRLSEAEIFLDQVAQKASLIGSSTDPVRKVSAHPVEHLEAILAKTSDPILRVEIETRVRLAWESPHGFRADAESLSVQQFWLDLIEKGSAQGWPESILKKLYANAVRYFYTVGNW